jgi:hemolysin activation/secretion protein
MLPSNEYSFSLSAQGEKTKQKFEGSFTVKCLLSNKELIEVGLRTDAYNNGSQSVSTTGVGLMNRAIAYLEVAITKAPSWWKDSDSGRELLDRNVLYEVYNKALDAEKVYDERISKAAEEAEEFANQNPKKAKKSAEG